MKEIISDLKKRRIEKCVSVGNKNKRNLAALKPLSNSGESGIMLTLLKRAVIRLPQAEIERAF